MRSSLRFVAASLLLTALAAPGCAFDSSERTPEQSGTKSVRQALPGPVPGVDITAEHAFVGDPLRGMGPGDPGSLYVHDSNEGAPMASTTKSFTLLLAVEAVAQGLVSLNDIVTISTKASNIDNAHVDGGHSEAGFPAGEQVRFEDLLYAMMIPSGGDASIAIAQHIAVKKFPNLANATDAAQEAAFVGMMNERAAELGLGDTEFFNPYGGDHAHADDNTPGRTVPHRASTRDMVKWFDVGMKSQLFRTIAGFQGTYSFNAVDGTAYSFSQTFSYPGMRAQKGGSNDGCITCLVGDARRIGRDLLVAYTQSQGGDGTTLLDYGFAELFHPVSKAIGPVHQGAYTKNALACVTQQRAASVVVKPNGTMQILVWGLDIGNGSIEHLNPLASLVVDIAAPNGSSGGTPGGIAYGGPSRGPSSGTPGGIVYGGPKPLVTDARIAYAGNGNLVVVAETTLGVYLYSYGITNEDTIVQRDVEVVGAGSDARVQVLHPTLVVTAHRDGAGNATLKTWRLDTVTGKLASPLATHVGAGVAPDEIELSGRPGNTSPLHLVLGYRSAGGSRVLRSFDIAGETGSITLKDSVSTNGGTRLALANVPGFGASRDIYALAFRNGQGRLAVDSYGFAPNGQIVRLAGTVDANGALDANAPIEIAAYREGGVMVATQPNPNVSSQRLDVWALDASATSTTITPNKVTSQSFFDNGLHGMCRVSTNAAEGDFLVATGKNDWLRLRAYRSGPRQ